MAPVALFQWNIRGDGPTYPYQQHSDRRTFLNSIDYFGWVTPGSPTNTDIPISAAIHNSARFLYLDAAGDILVNGHIVDRIVDGGYFENYGAATALDILEQLINRKAVGLLDAQQVGERTIDPLIIQISNDDQVPTKGELQTDASAPETPLGGQFRLLADAVTPVAAFYDTRDGLGQRATDVLRLRLAYLRDHGSNDARYFHFQIADNVPMSWLLSDYAGRLIDKQLPIGDIRPTSPSEKEARRFANVDQLCSLVRLLGGKTEPGCGR